jgi:hypothetical protein
MEKIPTIESEKVLFTERLLELGLATDVEPGLDIDATAYEITGDDEFVLERVLDVFPRYLNTPMIIDSFVSHEEERIPAYNESGIFEEFATEEFLNSKLRLNRISGVMNVLDSLKRSRQINAELRSFVAEIHSETLSGYNALPDEEKISLVRRLSDVIKKVFNKAIEVGELKGQEIS